MPSQYELAQRMKVSKPLDGVTRASTTLGSLGTPWTAVQTVPAEVVVEIDFTVSWQISVNDVAYFAVARDGTVIFKTGPLLVADVGTRTNSAHFRWVDESPTLGDVTYEVYAASASGTLTIMNAGSGTSTGLTQNAQSCMTVKNQTVDPD